jgi:hypothetical protein
MENILIAIGGGEAAMFTLIAVVLVFDYRAWAKKRRR